MSALAWQPGRQAVPCVDTASMAEAGSTAIWILQTALRYARWVLRPALKYVCYLMHLSTSHSERRAKNAESSPYA